MWRWGAALAIALAVRAAAEDTAPRAVVVSEVSPGSSAEAAGLRTGDRLARWQRGTDSGSLESPFDLTEVELEQGPRGPVSLHGWRGADPLVVSLFPDVWGLESRPALPPAAAAAHDAAVRGLHAGDSAATAARLGELRSLLQGRSLPDLQAWLHLQDARAASARRDADGASTAVEDGIRAAREDRRPFVEAQLLAALGWQLRDSDRYDAAEKALARADEVRRRLDPGSLAALALGEPIGLVAYAQGTPLEGRDRLVEQAAERIASAVPESLLHARTLVALGWLQGHPRGRESFLRAQSIAERLAPDSVVMAEILRAVAFVEPDAALRVELIRRAVRILERLAPESKDMVATLSALSAPLQRRGDAREALALGERALALVERIAPGSSRHANCLNNLGVYWMRRGDLVQAEAHFRRSLEIDQRLRPGSAFVGMRLFNLGEVLTIRRDFEQAEAQFQQALDIVERGGPGRAMSGRILYNLGEAQRGRGDTAGAIATLRRALELLTRDDETVNARERLADALVDAGRSDEAEVLYRQNLEYAARFPQPMILAARHHPLGVLAWRRRDLDEAERHLRTALTLRRETEPGTVPHAESSHALALVALERARLEEALVLLREAVEALEGQRRRLGGSEESKARFRAHFVRYYRDLEELLLRLGRESEAFETLERARAAGMPALLASRDLSVGGSVPEQLESERRRADQGYDQRFQALRAGGPDVAARERLTRELEEARREQETVRARIRVSAPRRAELRDPSPLDLAGVRRVLGAGTVLLSFSLGDQVGRVYAVGPGPADFGVFPVQATAGEVVEQVRRYREAIDSRRAALGQSAVTARAQALSDLLLRPAASALRGAERIVIVPDGPLFVLPWSALPDPAQGRLLVETRPVHVVSSATLLATLSHPLPRTHVTKVVGFGDPQYGRAGAGAANTPATPGLARAQASGLRLHPLPATRREVEALRALRAEAHLFLGPEATEERAKSVGADARFVHFACHGYLDERFPLESGLALSLPGKGVGGRGNGFLQAWEVFEDVRLAADLVTLSACQTGLGKEMAGEGLLGLTWAFQYAGARSVLASLWEVGDDSTADLMKRFYGHLAAGASKAEALRRAQSELRRRRGTSAPFYWAAFTLVGDGG